MKKIPVSYLPLILGVIVLGMPACSKKAVRSGGDMQALQDETAKGGEAKTERVQVFPIRRSLDVMSRTTYGGWIAILRKNGWVDMPVIQGVQAVLAMPTRWLPKQIPARSPASWLKFARSRWLRSLPDFGMSFSRTTVFQSPMKDVMPWPVMRNGPDRIRPHSSKSKAIVMSAAPQRTIWCWVRSARRPFGIISSSWEWLPRICRSSPTAKNGRSAQNIQSRVTRRIAEAISLSRQESSELIAPLA